MSRPQEWLGLGVDVLEIHRMRSLFARHGKRFLRIFSPHEIRWARRHKRLSLRLASLFAVKEAVFKSLGINPVFFMRWRDIELSPEKYAFKVRLKNTLKHLLKFPTEKITAICEESGGYVLAVAVRKRCAGF